MKDELPFYRIEGYPAQVTGTSALTRLVDRLGFRYHWATFGLTVIPSGTSSTDRWPMR
jgi:hypothetical protein